MFTADNMRFLLELSRTGRIADAAKRLDVDQTTVSRRITRLEKDMGARLFDRGSSGWQLTEAGRRLVPYAEAVESTLLAALDATSSAGSGSLHGTVRILTPDGFGAYVLVPGLGMVRDRHPDLFTELRTSTTHDLVTGRDFDLAVTLERPSPRSVSVSKLANYDLRLYASRRYLDTHSAIEALDDLEYHTLVWYVNAILDVEPLRRLERLLPKDRAHVQTNNITGHYQAVRYGVGIAPLPTYIGNADPDLVPVLPDKFVAERTYWLVVPRELARLARVQAVIEVLLDIVSENPDLRAPGQGGDSR
ncbi:DNA-binding transcriptional regulator, LysR family [Rhodococcus pyridinivorans]|uniref:LysR family transcriptional regulator n=1 Tax=Rhodococcus aetherivorans TaxID=191292 RepID=A0AA46SC43_9NOCA|nr:MULTISPECIES: LysR family transcriptional regulator [Rhodococcus]MCD5422808.1 LysR family transcriptional regulator [Rhodococcus pyridinivorans]MCW3472222.1 LysR family transcriptional regulator [Rhodococcus pyridinivorans]MDV6297213.1 LysR family transcriptional regulator [Rhodococcus aetherivorans]UYF97280.1 LysR family transcriptional regulator [Rhodococcus aetherivorans]SEC01890.1 DNA-binding transcriptional regulator, LysR family [Rhodococcus pyridinivorans]